MPVPWAPQLAPQAPPYACGPPAMLPSMLNAPTLMPWPPVPLRNVDDSPPTAYNPSAPPYGRNTSPPPVAGLSSVPSDLQYSISSARSTGTHAAHEQEHASCPQHDSYAPLAPASTTAASLAPTQVTQPQQQPESPPHGYATLPSLLPLEHHSHASYALTEPCAVAGCIAHVFCELAPCGCRLCRDHLGWVIRGARTVDFEDAGNDLDQVPLRLRGGASGSDTDKTTLQTRLDLANDEAARLVHICDGDAEKVRGAIETMRFHTGSFKSTIWAAADAQLPPSPTSWTPLASRALPEQLPLPDSCSTKLVRDLPAPLLPRYPSLVAPYTLRAQGSPLLADTTSLGDPPDELLGSFATFANMIGWQKRRQSSSPSEYAAFEVARATRRSILADQACPGEPPRGSWRMPGLNDIVFGPMSTDGISPAPTVFTPSLPVSLVVLTTFPVGGPDSSILDSADSRPEEFRWASTAAKLRDLQHLLVPDDMQDAIVWLDSNPAPRPAGERTLCTDPTQYAVFKATSQLIDLLKPPVQIITQSSNRDWIRSRIAPLWVRVACPRVSAASFLRPKEEFEQFWLFGSLQDDLAGTPPPGSRAITRREETLYFYHHVLDISADTKAHPRAVYVTNYHGCGFDTVLLFAPHPCTLDSLYYGYDTFSTAADELERAFTAARHLLARDAPGPPPGAVCDLFGLSGLGVYLKSRRFSEGTIGCLRELRKIELSSKRSFDAELSPSLRALAARHLLGSNSPDALVGYRPTVDPASQPPSIISDLLRHFSSLRLTELAKREEAEARYKKGEGPELSARDAAVLADARASDAWKARLELLGVQRIFFIENTQFRRGAQLYAKPDASDIQRQRMGLGASSEDSLLIWFPHFEPRSSEDESAADKGTSTKLWCRCLKVGDAGEVRGTGSSRMKIDGEACSSCARLDLPACAIPLDRAIVTGVIYRVHEPSDVESAVDAWETLLNEPTSYKRSAGHAAMREQVRVARAYLGDEGSSSQVEQGGGGQ